MLLNSILLYLTLLPSYRLSIFLVLQNIKKETESLLYEIRRR